MLAALAGSAYGDLMSSFGGAASMATGFLPPEMRGMAGTVANVALAGANKKKGILEFVMDGSDYPWICICPTTEQISQLKTVCPGAVFATDKCAEDHTFGCRPAQGDMSTAPMPTPTCKPAAK